nr:Nuclear inhibitor of protein phosphatase 1 [Hymenolepis microstoma]
MSGTSVEPLVNNFKTPSWAGKPPPGMHLDVMKEGKLIQKLLMDEKPCYFFGRNHQLCDFPIDHESCSRIHAALVWHKHLNMPFLIDLGSVHGTFIGCIRLERDRPQKVAIDSEIHFGASKRIYIIRERPNQINGSSIIRNASDDPNSSLQDGESNLPKGENELEQLTQFNTAKNRKIEVITDINMPTPNVKQGRRNSLNQRLSVHFSEVLEEVINPEDVDPSIGRFRNLVQETFIPFKSKHEGADIGIISPKSVTPTPGSIPRDDEQSNEADEKLPSMSNPSFSLAAKLGLPMPNLAPDIDSLEPVPLTSLHRSKLVSAPRLSAEDIMGGPLLKSGEKRRNSESESADGEAPKKKKYAKEAWPGKRPGYLVGPSGS